MVVGQGEESRLLMCFPLTHGWKWSDRFCYYPVEIKVLAPYTQPSVTPRSESPARLDISVSPSAFAGRVGPLLFLWGLARAQGLLSESFLPAGCPFSGPLATEDRLLLMWLYSCCSFLIAGFSSSRSGICEAKSKPLWLIPVSSLGPGRLQMIYLLFSMFSSFLLIFILHRLSRVFNCTFWEEWAKICLLHHPRSSPSFLSFWRSN